MEVKVEICTDATGCVKAVLFDHYSPRTFKAVLNALPIESVAYRWGDEVYFETPVVAKEENSREVVDVGSIAFWPPGNALCVFWGPTPASRSPDEIRPASSVNVIGQVADDPKVFSKVSNGMRIVVRLAEG